MNYLTVSHELHWMGWNSLKYFNNIFFKETKRFIFHVILLNCNLYLICFLSVEKSKVDDSWLNYDAKRQALKTCGEYKVKPPVDLRIPRSQLPKVETPHPGLSYNPSLADHKVRMDIFYLIITYSVQMIFIVISFLEALFRLCDGYECLNDLSKEWLYMKPHLAINSSKMRLIIA